MLAQLWALLLLYIVYSWLSDPRASWCLRWKITKRGKILTKFHLTHHVLLFEVDTIYYMCRWMHGITNIQQYDCCCTGRCEARRRDSNIHTEIKSNQPAQPQAPKYLEAQFGATSVSLAAVSSFTMFFSMKMFAFGACPLFFRWCTAACCCVLLAFGESNAAAVHTYVFIHMYICNAEYLSACVQQQHALLLYRLCM